MTRNGKIAVVTGAGGGLGAAVARRLASSGTAVACVDVHSDAVMAVADSLSTSGARAEAFTVDITDEQALADLAMRVHDRLGAVSMVMNVAGILGRGQLAETDAAAFRRVVDVNLTGTYLVTRAFFDDLVSGGWGRVVNTASMAGITGYPFPAYAASKAGVVNLTRSLLVDFWGTGVTVNAVCPGPMDTPMMDDSARPRFVANTPSARVVSPDEVACVFEFLAREECGSVNGQAIVADGGATSVFRWPSEVS